MKQVIPFTLLFFSVLCFSGSNAQERDSVPVLYQRDSVITSPTEQAVLFFQQAEQPTDPSKITVINKAGRAMSLAALIKSMGGPMVALTDLDHDAGKELLMYQFTGSSSSVFNDEVSVYRIISINKYQYAGKLSAGHTRITDSLTFNFRLFNYFNDFLNCPDCRYRDAADEAPISLHRIMIRFNKGKFAVIKGDQELRSMINDNLGKFSEMVTAIDKVHPDDGIRKEIAENLAVYYYSFGKNMTETQRLFNKYYKLPDAKKIWTAFTAVVQKISAQNSF